MVEKNKAIKELIKHLFKKFGSDKILIKDHWVEDENAIGLCELTGQFLVYISVYEDEPNKFYIALENPPTSNDFPYTAAGEFDNLKLSEIEIKIASHLRLDFVE